MRSGLPKFLNSILITFFLSIVVSSSGCVTSQDLPIDEWNIARAAYDAARDADASRYVPAMWFNAEQTYREAMKSYKDRHYTQAKKQFVEAQRLCELAENQARLARHQSGEIVP